MKYIYGILLLTALMISCTKEIKLEFNNLEEPLVVNCLFSEDEPWKLYLAKAKMNNEFQDFFISNAIVRVEADGNNPLVLDYVGDGTYLSDQYPTSGVTYKLYVDVPGYEMLTARGEIPNTVEVSDVEYSDQQITYFFPNTMEDFDVAPLCLDLKTNTSAFIRFRFYSFNSRTGYLRYQLTDEAIHALKNDVPESCLIELEKLKGEIFTDSKFIHEIRRISEECDYHLLEIKLMEVINKFSVDTRETEAFSIESIFPATNWLHNISIDFRTLLGELEGEQETDLFIDYLPVLNKGNATDYTVEYWLELVSMDENYYRYQKSYIQQAFQIGNPYTNPVQVHSNIENGVGIFAGYNRQMFHFYDY